MPRRIGLTVLVVMAAVAAATFLAPAWRLNLASVHLLEALLKASSTAPVVQAAEGLAALDSCRGAYLLGAAANSMKDEAGRQAAWSRTLECAPERIALMALLAPDDARLAQEAVNRQPESAESWFWLGGSLAQTQSEAAILAYRQGLSLAPTDGLRWYALGDLLRPLDTTAAIEAYLQACRHGDPGSNGCFQAGLTAERMGDIPAALRYLRMSKWSGALDYANTLEAKQTPIP
jgi:tetratricopeptide (TPR) repeat protein